MKRVFFTILLMLALHCCFGDPAEAQSVFPAPTGIQLSTGGAHSYSAAGVPNWTVTAFTPAGFPAFPAFTGNISRSAAGWVLYHANGRISFKADGALEPCNATQNGSSQVVEYDLMADPPVAKPLLSLSTLKSAVLTDAVYYQAYAPPAGATCTINWTNVGDNLILKNTVNGQVLFYQLRLGGSGVDGGMLHIDTGLTPFWFEQGINQQTGSVAQFGYNDTISVTYGIPMWASGQYKIYHVDVLPKLKALIQAGPPSPQAVIDTNLAHWTIAEYYGACANWGKGACRAGIGGMSLVLK